MEIYLTFSDGAALGAIFFHFLDKPFEKNFIYQNSKKILFFWTDSLEKGGKNYQLRVLQLWGVSNHLCCLMKRPVLTHYVEYSSTSTLWTDLFPIAGCLNSCYYYYVL